MSDEEVTELGPSRGMDEEEAALAKQFEEAIQRAATDTARGQQASEFRVGMSDLGYCSERTKRMLDQEVPEDSDMFKAWLGTVIGDGFEDALVAYYSHGAVVKQAEVTVTLEGDRRTYEVPGHPDLIFPDEALVIDGKTAFGLEMARRTGADQQKQFQRHAYGKGAWLKGFFGETPLEEVRVGNVWLDRSGATSSVHVQIEPFSDEVLASAAQWLDEVVEAYVTGQTAMKEPPREVCAATCGFFGDCRAMDTDAAGLLEGTETIEAVQMYLDGKELAKQGESFKKQAKAVLAGKEGSTGDHIVRWVGVDPVFIEGYERRGYTRLDIRAIH
jgi:hypothetical protein